MLDNLKKAVNSWWVFLIIGIVALVCGFILVCNPATGFNVLSILVTIVLIVAGIGGIVYVIMNRKQIPAYGWYLILPILLIVFGIITAGTFGGSQAFLISLFAVGVMFKGIESITCAISCAGIKGSGWGWTLAGGICLVLLSGFLFANPFFNAIVLGYMVAFAMIFIGMDAIAISFQLSRVKSAVKTVEKAAEAVYEAENQEK